MEILLVPHPILRQKANKLKSISKEDINIADHMMETMIKAPGVGLAANQVGILKQIVTCLLYTSPSPRDGLLSRMPSSA